MFGGVEPVGVGLGSLKGEVAVQFDHGVAGLDGFVGVNLNLVIVLTHQREGAENKPGE
jgi:hypothetical protein